MKALVVFESMFGNSEKVARAIATGLAETMEVEVLAVADAPPAVPGDIDLLVIGGPTHAFSMSRRATREDAVKQGSTAPVAIGLRDWLAELPAREGAATVTTFDTRANGARHLPGSAAKSAARSARRHGFTYVERGESFYVDDVAGPLLEGETDRATEWGQRIAQARTAREGAHGAWT